MKILITTDLYTTDTNGVVVSVRNLAEALTALGHSVRILTLSESKTAYQKDNVYFCGTLSLNWIYPNVRGATRRTNNYVKELIAWKPDIIHSQCEMFSFRYAKYISKKTGAPIVHTYHTLYEQYVTYVFPFRRIGEKSVSVLSRRLLKTCKAIIAPTHKTEVALREYGIKQPIAIIPTGISLEQHYIPLPPGEREGKRKALGIPDGAFVFLNLGRLGKEKNIHELIEGFDALAEQSPNAFLLIVGDGPDRADLEGQASECKHRERILFAGMVPPERVHEYYRLGDVFVSASTSETQGLTYIEAAANGLPLLCRRDPCLQNVILDGENGYQFETVAQYTEYAERMQNDTDFCRRAGERSVEISKQFDKWHFGVAVEQEYKKVLSES